MFDTKLASKIYVQYLKSSCQKSLDILRVVGHTDWRADRTVLLRLYRALVRSKLDYGCIVYGSARRLVLKQLDQIHHQGLRIALEAFRTSLAQSLYVEAYEPYLTSRRLNLSLNYVLKLKSLPENQAYKYVFEPENTQLFEESESKILLLDMRIVPHLEKSKINLNLIDDAPSLDIGHSMLSAPTVRLDLTKFKKNTTNPERTNSFIHSLLLNILCVKVSQTVRKQAGVAAAAVSTKRSQKTFTCRLPDDSSIYTVKLQAILLALRHTFTGIRCCDPEIFIKRRSS